MDLISIERNKTVQYKEAHAWVAELVDARDLKSLGPCGCAGSIPAPGTITTHNTMYLTIIQNEFHKKSLCLFT